MLLKHLFSQVGLSKPPIVCEELISVGLAADARTIELATLAGYGIFVYSVEDKTKVENILDEYNLLYNVHEVNEYVLPENIDLHGLDIQSTNTFVLRFLSGLLSSENQEDEAENMDADDSYTADVDRRIIEEVDGVTFRLDSGSSTWTKADIEDELRSPSLLISTTLPSLPPLFPLQGRASTSINASSVKVSDMTFDRLSPWSKKEGPRSKSYVYALGDQSLRVVRSTHPNLPLKKVVAYISDCNQNITSSILVQYVAFGPIVKWDHDISARLKPSQTDAVRKAMINRSAPNVAKMFPQIPRSKVYNISRAAPSVIKSNRGPKSMSSASALSELATKHENIVFKIAHEKGKPSFRCMSVYDGNIELYLAQCPTKKKRTDHMRTVNLFDTLDKSSRNRLLQSLTSNVCSSQLMKGHSVLAVDVTFDVSHMYLTVVIGYAALFRTRRSGKARPIILASMVHSTKGREHHQDLADLLSRTFAKLDDTKCVSSVISDAESALSVYSERLNATRLLCDVHRRCNFEAAMGTEHLSLIFGSAHKGELKRGLLGALNKEEFENALSVLQGKVPKEVFSWLSERKETLFEYHSMRKKLEGGVFMQYCTNNLLESLNNVFKNIFTRSTPGEEVVVRLQEYVRGQYELYKKAAMGEICEVKCLSSEYIDWNHMDEAQRSSHMRGIGFGDVSAVLPIPQFILREITMDSHFKSLLPKIESLRCTEVCKDKFFIESKVSRSSISIVERGHGLSLRCQNERCIRAWPKLCEHILCTWIQGKEDEQLLNIVAWKRHVASLGSQAILRANHSLKDGSKRKFSGRSKNNDARCINAIYDTSLFDSFKEDETLLDTDDSCVILHDHSYLRSDDYQPSDISSTPSRIPDDNPSWVMTPLRLGSSTPSDDNCSEGDDDTDVKPLRKNVSRNVRALFGNEDDLSNENDERNGYERPVKKPITKNLSRKVLFGNEDDLSNENDERNGYERPVKKPITKNLSRKALFGNEDDLSNENDERNGYERPVKKPITKNLSRKVLFGNEDDLSNENDERNGYERPVKKPITKNLSRKALFGNEDDLSNENDERNGYERPVKKPITKNLSRKALFGNEDDLSNENDERNGYERPVKKPITKNLSRKTSTSVKNTMPELLSSTSDYTHSSY